MIERRQMTRYNFGAIAQVIDLDSREDVIAVTRDLSLSGCFVKTKTPLPQGKAVIVRITCLGEDFAATGTVTGNVTWEGMGIEFDEIKLKDQAIIEQWLDPNPRRRQEHLIRDVAVAMPGQNVRLKNRLTREGHNCRVLPIKSEPKTDAPRPLASEFLQAAWNFWKFQGESRNQASKDPKSAAHSRRNA